MVESYYFRFRLKCIYLSSHAAQCMRHIFSSAVSCHPLWGTASTDSRGTSPFSLLQQYSSTLWCFLIPTWSGEWIALLLGPRWHRAHVFLAPGFPISRALRIPCKEGLSCWAPKEKLFERMARHEFPLPFLGLAFRGIRQEARYRPFITSVYSWLPSRVLFNYLFVTI